MSELVITHHHHSFHLGLVGYNVLGLDLTLLGREAFWWESLVEWGHSMPKLCWGPWEGTLLLFGGSAGPWAHIHEEDDQP